ncbi:MAG: molecular chaperone [Methanosarcinales archaeon]
MNISAEKAFYRSKIYGLLSLGFLYPSDDLKKSLKDGSYISELRELVALLDLPKKDELKEVLECLENDIPKDPKKLEEEYTSIFLKNISPHETEYYTEQKMQFAKTRELADIAGFYLAFGLEVSDKQRDRVDHISTELEFMHFLTLKEAIAQSNGNVDGEEICVDAEKKFLVDHLGRWVGAFSKVIKKEVHYKFYAPLAEMIRQFVSLDSNYLQNKIRGN